MFHFKFIHHKLALNPWLYKCGIKTDEKCTLHLCGSDTETLVHLFCNCIKVRVLWEKIKIDLFDNNEDILPFWITIILCLTLVKINVLIRLQYWPNIIFIYLGVKVR